MGQPGLPDLGCDHALCPDLPVGPAAGNTLWAGTGTLCASHNDGDPITQFDQLANRWMMSQFALSFPDDFHQCIAVSATADPLGTWYLYDFQTSTVNMNDYPKFGVWSDGYYMTINQFDGVDLNLDWRGRSGLRTCGHVGRHARPYDLL